MYYKAHELLKKARNNKNGYKIILDRWNNDDKCRKCLSDIGWTEESIIHFDEIASENYSYIATKRRKKSEREIMETFIEAEGFQEPLD